MTNNSWNSDYNSTKGSLLVGNGTRPVVRTVGTNGQVLTADSAQADGVNWSSLTSFSTLNVQTKTGTGAFTYTPTTGMKYVIVELLGAGGSAGGTAATAAGQAAAAGGGAAGGYAKFLLTAAQVGVSLTGSVGAGGANVLAGNPGNAGGNTTLATAAPWTVSGGAGGIAGAASAAATSGGTVGGGNITAGTGVIIITVVGQDGGSGFSNATVPLASPGVGGASFYCTQTIGRTVVATGSSVNSLNALSKGGGGSGGASVGVAGGLIGRAGGDGVAIFTEYA